LKIPASSVSSFHQKLSFEFQPKTLFWVSMKNSLEFPQKTLFWVSMKNSILSFHKNYLFSFHKKPSFEFSWRTLFWVSTKEAQFWKKLQHILKASGLRLKHFGMVRITFFRTGMTIRKGEKLPDKTLEISLKRYESGIVNAQIVKFVYF